MPSLAPRRLAPCCLATAALVLLAGCATPRDRPAIASYDFGLAARAGAAPVYAARLPAAIAVANVEAPSWMDTPGVVYRLAFRTAARPEVYSASRWVMPPAELLSDRIRSTFAARGVALATHASPSIASLRVELEEFSQVFDSETTSRVVLRARVSSAREGGPLRQTVIQIDRPAPSPDARGAVTALAAASDELIEQLLGWID